MFCVLSEFKVNKFRSLTAHAADPSKIQSSKELRISLGPELSWLWELLELSELSVPGSLASWLPDALAAWILAAWLCGSLAR